MDQVKADILSFMADMRLDVGDAFPVRPFFIQRATKYTPPQHDAIGPAFDSLVAEGVLEARDGGHFLSPDGLKRLYPHDESAVVNFVKDDILDFLRTHNARAGSVFAVRPFGLQRYAKYNPLQQKVFEKAVAELVADGVFEARDGGHFLTDPGYRKLY